MSEKLKLFNGQEFDLIPMGIVTDDAKKVRYFKFTSELTHEELKAIFFDSTNLANIDYIQEDGAIKTYQDCVKMLVLSFVPNYQVDDNTTADIYVVTVSTDEVLRGMENAKEERDAISGALEAVICMMMGA